MNKVSKAGMAAIAVSWALTLLGAAPASAATISGTVSDENTHSGIAGVEVCPTPQPYEFEAECAYTDAGGHYSLTGLRPFSYKLYFSGWQGNLRYVSEYWNDKLTWEEADLVTLGSPEETRQIDVGLAEGGSIAGTVIDEDTHLPIEGLAACAWETGSNYQRCDKSDAAGHYEINGLPSGEYFVEYEGWDQVNYIREVYKDGQAEKVEVTAPGTTSGIDEELKRGAEILGHVSEATSGAPVEGAMVCAPPQSAADADINQNCDWTDAAGNYAIRGLPAGTYQVGFDVEWVGPFGGPSAFEWWQGAMTRAGATLLELNTPSSTSGIDGRASRPYYPSPPPPVVSTPPILVTPVEPRPRLPKCKKGFHRRLVKGKKRCVRKHRRHRRHHRHQV